MRRIDINSAARLVGPALFLVALAVYIATLSRGACPGESAMQLGTFSGLQPRVTPLYPLWAWLVGIVSLLPVGGLAAKLNVLSAVFGALSVWLLYIILRDTVSAVIDREVVEDKTATVAAMLAGATAALFFAFCVPFWTACNRADMASFHVLLFLSTLWFLVRYAISGGMKAALVFAFLYGVGCVEFATFIVFAPLFGLILLLLMAHHDHLRIGPLVGTFAVAIVGLSLYLVAAALFLGTDGCRLSGCGGFLDAVLIGWKAQFRLIARSLPPQGWLIIVITCAAPWLATLVVARRGLNGEKEWAFTILHAMMTVISLMVAFDTRLSPTGVLPGIGLVTPNLLSVIVLGYVASYWFLVLRGLFHSVDRRSHVLLRRAAGILTAVVFLGVACALPFKNARQTDTSFSGIANDCALETVRSLSGRSWLVTDGGSDILLQLAAGDIRVPLKILNLSRERQDGYMGYVASLFDQPRMKNLARIGMLPLLEGWFATDPDICEKVALVSLPGLFGNAGLTAVPNKMVYLGAKAGKMPDPAGLLEAHRAFWRDVTPGAKKADEEEAVFGSMFAATALRQMGQVANNLGVLMEDAGRSDEAFEAYSQAHEIDPNNVCVLLNMEAMLRRGSVKGDISSVTNDLRALSLRYKEKPGMFAFTRYYGDVRDAAVYAETAAIWSRMGRAGMAVAYLNRAVKLLPAAKKRMGMTDLAGLYLTHGMNEKSEAAYRGLLAEDPNDGKVLLALARIARTKMDLEAAKRYLVRAEAAGADKTRIAIELANIDVISGEYGHARASLDALISENPSMIEAWQLLCEVLIHENDRSALEDSLNRMGKIEGAQTAVALVNASVALGKKDTRAARRFLEQVHAARPDDVTVLGRLIMLDIANDDTVHMLGDAKSLLRLEPDHPFANYAMGVLLAQEGEVLLAEDSFRQSLQKERIPHALSGLAMLLQKQRKYAEAERLAREALGNNSKMPKVWDTLGVIMVKTSNAATNRLGEAEKAFNTALSLAPDGPIINLHMAGLQAQIGKTERARELVSKILPKRYQLPEDEQADLDRLVKSLGV